MVTDNRNPQKKSKGLDNQIQQNHSFEQEEEDRGNGSAPVNNGGVDLSIEDIELEKQWIAVRDEYLAHYPSVVDANTTFEKATSGTIINNIADKTQRTPKAVRNEIMNWSAKD